MIIIIIIIIIIVITIKIIIPGIEILVCPAWGSRASWLGWDLQSWLRSLTFLQTVSQ